MYIFLEDDIVIKSSEIEIILNFKDLDSEINREFFKSQKESKEIIYLTDKDKKSVVVTASKIYITKYGTQTLMTRGHEFLNIVGGNRIEQ